jgi:ribonuclease HII
MLKRYHTKGKIEAGTDEAGRGCLAGPVVVAAVILPSGYKNKILNDSKQLSKKTRNELRAEIESVAVSFGVAIVPPEKIDEINILNASIYGMHVALQQLQTQPELILVDGNRFKPYANIQHHCIIKGDATYLSIAAASVLAKTYRDELMEQLHESFPHYRWNENMGYPTKTHRAAIASHGACIHHRKTFKLLAEEQLRLL